MGEAAGVTDAVAAAFAGAIALPVAILIDAAARPLALEWVHLANDDQNDGAEAQAMPNSADAPLPYLLGPGSSIRRALVVSATVLVFVVLGLQYGWSWRLPVVTVYAAILLACSVTDFLVHRIPNVFVFPATAFALAIGAFAPGADLPDVLLGGAISGGALLLMVLVPGSGTGIGDVKLALFTGLALGAELAFAALIIGMVLGGLAALGLLVRRYFKGGGRYMAYGPYLALGALLMFAFRGTAFVRL